MKILSIITGFFAAIGMLFTGSPHVQPAPALPIVSVPSSASVQTPQPASGVTSNTNAPSTITSTATKPLTSIAIPVATASTVPVAEASTYPAGSAWMTTLPLGDGKYSTSTPKPGSIYLCHVGSGGGAMVNGSWIHGSTWNPGEKFAVQGDVSWPNASYTSTITGSTRVIKSNDLPTDHTTGIFPIQASDPAAQIDRNPSSITAQNLSFSLPAYPTAANSPGCIYGEVGIMNDGVWLFDGFDAENRDALAHEMQDDNDGHPNQEGYHYHGFTTYLKDLPVTRVVGFAFDGYPITGPQLPSGKYLTTSDLDECHGMTSTIILDGKSVSSYHYVLTEDFPYSVSCFHGNSTFKPMPQGSNVGGASGQMQQGGSQQPTQVGTPPAPPQAAIDACIGKSSGASCTVSGGPSGICTMIGTSFACKPQ